MRSSHLIHPLAMDDVLLAAHGGPLQRPFLDLCIGCSSFDVTCHARIGLSDALASTSRYGDPVGHEALRRGIARHLLAQTGVEVEPARIIVTEGASGALMVVLAMLLEPDGEILVPEICYPPYRVLVHLLGGRSIPVPMKSRHLDLAALRSQITPRTQAILLNTPHNPLGSVTSLDDLRELASLGIPVISDEVYRSIVLNGAASSILQASDQHFMLDSFSKSFAVPGIRLGFAVVPEAMTDLASMVKVSLHVATSRVSQRVGLELLELAPKILVAHREFLLRRRDLFFALGPRLGLHLGQEPDAGFYGLVDVRGSGMSTTEIALRLARDHAVAIAPGADFAVVDPGFLRINFSCPEPDLTAGMTALASVLQHERKARKLG